jgi:Asp-tRNA(Asn)/Glu-tRNA(Gln) amidotransferase A subunit family amidase
LTAARLAQLIARRELSSEEVVADCLEQARRREGEVRAWQYLDPELALEQARARDREEPAGPLHGVPVGVKDIIDTADMPTELGTSIHEGRRPQADAACVTRLREAGAVILGKTVTTEFATKHPAGTTNPHNPGHTPGGSSSGSAAAVAAEMVPLALGTQTVGSTIRPASFCGVYGMKPTWGLVDMAGVNQTSERLDTIGLFSRDAGDLELLLDVLAPGPDRVSSNERPLRVGVARTPWWPVADEDSAAAFDRAVEALREARVPTEEIELPADFENLPDVHDTITVADLAGCLGHEHDAHRDQLSESLRVDIERGKAVTKAEYDDAVARTDRWRDLVRALFEECDALLAPAVTGEAPEGLGWTGDPTFCRPWSLLGTPAVTVPIARGSSGLPVGVQLVGPHGADRALLGIAGRLGAAT